MSQRKRLSILLSINIGMIVLLLAAGLISHSLSVLAAGGDFIVDSAAILLGILAVTIRDRALGRSNATTYVALINATLLLIITAWVIIEAIHRLISGTPEIHGLTVLLVSVFATVAMLFGVWVLGKDAGREDLHMRSVMLDTLADASSSAAVAITGLIIFISNGTYWLDSVVAICISLVIGFSVIRLLIEVWHALRTGTELKMRDDD